jgi:hypothetical protein
MPRPGAVQRIGGAPLRSFWRLPWSRRATGGACAALTAFVTFISGLVILFDRVGATKGHSAEAWAVSIAGLICSLTLGLAFGLAVLARAAHLSRAVRSTSAYLGRLLLEEAAFVVLLCVVFVRID